MSAMNFYKVEVLPSDLVPNAVYFVPDETTGLMTICVSDSTGKYVRSTPSTRGIHEMAREAASTSLVIAVPNYLSLSTLDTNVTRIAFVIDATGDSTVKGGAATYIFNNVFSEWVKVSEFESMDLIITWSNIVNKPVSTTAQIDAAVTDSHTHANAATLNRFGVNAAGLPTYTTSTGQTEDLILGKKPLRYFNADGEILGEKVAYVATIPMSSGTWSVNYAHMNFKSIVDWHCTGMYSADAAADYCIPAIDSRTVTLTGLSGYATTRVGAGLLAAVELTKSDKGSVRVTVIGVI